MGVCVHISIEMTFKLFKATHNHQLKHLRTAPIFYIFHFSILVMKYYPFTISKLLRYAQ